MKKRFWLIALAILIIVGIVSCAISVGRRGNTANQKGIAISRPSKAPVDGIINDEVTANFDKMMMDNATGNFDYGEYKMDNKTLRIDLEFITDDVFRVGTVTAIRNLVLEHLSGKYGEESIRLQIASENPVDLVVYFYENGAWNKEVK